MAKYTLKLNEDRVNTVIGGHSKAAVRRAAFHVQRRARANVKAAGRVDTGKMMNSIQAKERKQGSPLLPRYYIQANVPYAKFQENGTRAHGPVTAKALRFTPKGGGQVVYAKWVRGVTPAYFMRDAFRAITLQDFVVGGK